MPQIFTSSWFVPRATDCLIIGISRGTPRGQKAGYRRYPKLSPGPWFRSIDPQEFCSRYFEEVLAQLDPATVVAELTAMAGQRKAVLVCYEPPPPDERWCHRALVSAWLWSTLGLAVPELGCECEGVGWQHPKLHPSLIQKAR
jgi:hypothetical protein